MTPRDRIRHWQLYVITDRRLSRGRAQQNVIRAAIAGGADAVQFRDKEASGREFFLEAQALRDLCREAGIAFIVNDRIDVALALGADGAHVGQEDMPARAARELLGPERILGVSVATPEEAIRAAADGADYLGAGPVFEARTTKPDALSPIGAAGLRAICAVGDVPVIAIGGITADNVSEVLAAGAVGVAAISALVFADDVEAAARRLKQALQRPRED